MKHLCEQCCHHAVKMRHLRTYPDGFGDAVVELIRDGSIIKDRSAIQQSQTHPTQSANQLHTHIPNNTLCQSCPTRPTDHTANRLITLPVNNPLPFNLPTHLLTAPLTPSPTRTIPMCKDLSMAELSDDDVKHFYTFDGKVDLGDPWEDAPIPALTHQTGNAHTHTKMAACHICIHTHTLCNHTSATHVSVCAAQHPHFAVCAHAEGDMMDVLRYLSGYKRLRLPRVWRRLLNDAGLKHPLAPHTA